MTIRDIKVLMNIIKDKLDLGLPLDSLVNKEFEKNLKHIILFFQMELILFMSFLI